MKKIITIIMLGILALTATAGCGKNKEADTVSFSKESGVYESGFDLTLKAGKQEIYYTLDGSDPTVSDTAVLYKDSIRVDDRSGEENVVSAVSPSLITTNFSEYDKKDGITSYIKAPSDDAVDKITVVRAASRRSDGSFTPVVTKNYFIGSTSEHIQGIEESCQASGNTLAVISITMDYDDLFDSEKGIYVKGNIFDEAFAKFEKQNSWFKADDTRKLDANYSQRGRDWERSAHMEFFEMDENGAVSKLSQDCGIRIQGNYSRSDLQKGFRLYARDEYGDNRFRYEVFGEELQDTQGKTIDKFKTLVLRAGGNCAFTSKYNDTYWQTLVSGVDCTTKASRPCVVYLNGEYWGLYVLEEDYSDNYFKSHFDVEKENVIVYKGDAETYSRGYKLDEGELPEGITDEKYFFRPLLDFFKTHDNLENDEDFEEFAALVDTESLMDYFAVEVWINNKWDWPGKNWSMWKSSVVDESNPYADGKWRFCLYDIEFGGVSGESDAYTNTIKEDNYKPLGLLDKDTKNPAVRCFVYAMSNEGFRTEYCNRLLNMSSTFCEKEKALELLDEFEGTYGPLFDQFFDRYPGCGSSNEALYGSYASSKCIRDFLGKRENYIKNMTDWVNRQY